MHRLHTIQSHPILCVLSLFEVRQWHVSWSIGRRDKREPDYGIIFAHFPDRKFNLIDFNVVEVRKLNSILGKAYART